jgi:putative NADH-flavin reductase
MRILLLGATGRTGRYILQQALQRGHYVHVLVRDRQKIKTTHERLIVFEGTPADSDALSKAMRSCDAVISALNISRHTDWPWSALRTPRDFLSTVMRLIIERMQVLGISRFIFTSAWGVAETKKDIPAWFRWFIDHSNVKYPYVDHAKQEELVWQSSLEWTGVRAAGLTNSRKKKPVIVSFNNSPAPRLTISRSNLACFMLDVLEKNLYVRQLPVVSTKGF